MNDVRKTLTTAIISALGGGVAAIAFGAVTVSARLAVVEAKVEDLRVEIRELRRRVQPPITESAMVLYIHLHR